MTVRKQTISLGKWFTQQQNKVLSLKLVTKLDAYLKIISWYYYCGIYLTVIQDTGVC